MICQWCEGERTLLVLDLEKREFREVPCPNCMGSGIDYCCGGERAEPDCADRARRETREGSDG